MTIKPKSSSQENPNFFLSHLFASDSWLTPPFRDLLHFLSHYVQFLITIPAESGTELYTSFKLIFTGFLIKSMSIRYF